MAAYVRLTILILVTMFLYMTYDIFNELSTVQPLLQRALYHEVNYK